MELKSDDKVTAAIILILIVIFSFVFWGFIGFKVVLGMLLVFFLPFYLILGNFNLLPSERIIFAFFIGVGIFPVFVYWLGVFISFKLAVAIVFVLLILLGLLIKRLKKP